MSGLIHGESSALGGIRAAFILLLAVSQAAMGVNPGRPPLKVEADPRVELLSLIFRLAGNPEYSQGKVDSYTKDAEERFGRLRDHDAVRAARNLRANRGVSYDAVMSMAVHVKDAYGLEERVPFDPRPESLDGRWRPEEARDFLAKARRFAKESGFRVFMEERQPLFKLAADRLRTVIETKGHLEWFDEYFGPRPGAGFRATFGMLNGGCCYGPRIRLADGTEELVCVLGVWKTDSQGKPDFDGSVLDTVVHEFAHSYVNPVVDRFAPRIEKSALIMHPFVAEAMKKQAYGDWRTIICESVVRASVVRYVHRISGPEEARKQISSEIRRSFLWTKELSDLFGEYEAKRAEYQGFEAFFPKVVAFFEAYAPRFAQEQSEFGKKKPKVVSINPVNGTQDVDPALDKITVVFDRPMRDGSWSMVGGGPRFPESAGKPSYDDSKKTWTKPVRLKPDWEYEFWLNSDKFQAFQSGEGIPLDPVHIRFRTSAGK